MEFTKSDMIVGKHAYKRRDGVVHTWDKYEAKEDYYNTNFTMNSGEKEFDIMEVYELVPIWTREEVQEMTIEEISELLGRKIKIVEG